jgi:hypothetical protein
MGLSPLPIPRGYIAAVANLEGLPVTIESGQVYFVLRIDGGKMMTAFYRVTAALTERGRYELTPLTADAERNAAQRFVVTAEAFERRDEVAILGILLGSSMRRL